MAKEVVKSIRLELDDQQRADLGEVMEVTGMRSAKPALWYAVRNHLVLRVERLESAGKTGHVLECNLGAERPELAHVLSN